MKIVKKILFLMVLSVMIIPVVQRQWPFVSEPPLNGAFVENKLPELNWKNIYNGNFETAYTPYLEQHIGFHNTFVRLNNQLDYSLFRKPNAEGVVIGKKSYIFEYDYIREITGRDFVGYDFIDKKLRRLKYVQQYLKSTKNINLVFVFMPGKASFFREYIPNKYLRKVSDSNNYSVYLGEMKKRNIRYVDLDSYFHQEKIRASYPMFPKYGTHWSIYGMSLAAHVWLDSIEKFSGRALNDFNTDSLYFSTTPLRTDYDGGKTLNLLCNLSKERFAYPNYVFGHDSSRYKPHVLVIGDSFYWNIFNAGIPKNLFANEAFWYYNFKVYPDFYFHPEYTHDLNLKNEVEKMNQIFIMTTERFLNIFDWHFIDQVYAIYTPDYIQDPIYDIINEMVLDANWFNRILKEALANGISPGQMLYDNAKYLFYKRMPFDYLVKYGPEPFENYLIGNEKARIMLTKQAKEKNTSFDKVLEDNAMYLFWKQKPKAFKQYKKIRSLEEQIKNTPKLIDSVRRLADKYNCRLADMIFYQARYMADDSLQEILRNIRSDPNWMKMIRQKAAAKNIPFDKMLYQDARYILESNEKKKGD